MRSKTLFILQCMLVMSCSTQKNVTVSKPTHIPANEVSAGDSRYTYGLSQPDTSFGIICEYNKKLPARDGVMLEYDIYRPDKEGKYPVIISLAPYVRGGDDDMSMLGVDSLDRGGVGTKLELFEQPNPEFWIPRGYIFITVNPRGFGGSEGKNDAMLQSEHEDFYDAIEWAAVQPWSTGKVGIAGISYYAFSQYGTAALQPPHLCAAVPWEGLVDPYRDIGYRGGMRTKFGTFFMLKIDILKSEPILKNSFFMKGLRHKLMDDFWYERGSDVDLSKIEVPFLSVGNLSDVDLHLRGNVEAFMAAKSPSKKLHLYAGTHWGSAYQPWATREVLRFFDHWLKGIDTGLEQEPAVNIELRTTDSSFKHVYGDSYPLPQTKWQRLNMDTKTCSLVFTEVTETNNRKAEKGTQGGKSERIAFRTEPLKEDIAIAGPMTCHLWISSTSKDADISIVVNDIDENGNETLFPYFLHHGDDEPVSRGWLRASHRAIDSARTLPYRPFHKHTQNDWLKPNQPVALDIEIWPTSMLFKAGHRIEVVVHTGKYERRGELGRLYGKDPEKKRSDVYNFVSKGSGKVTLYSGGQYASWIDLPTIPIDTNPVHKITLLEATFVPKICSGQIGDKFEFVNESEDYHSSTEQSGLKLWNSQLIRGTNSYNPETWGLIIPWASTFHYKDEVYGNVGTIAVAPKINSIEKGLLKITLATAPLPKGVSFEVEIKYGTEPWKALDSNIVAQEFELRVPDNGVIAVRVRLIRKSDGVTTDWSPESEWRFD